MKLKPLFVFTLLLILFGCKNKSFKAPPLLHAVERYKYQYAAEKLIAETETYSSYSNGVIENRIKTVKQYTYDNNNRIVKVIEILSIDSITNPKNGKTSIDPTLSSTTFTRYNNNDSVIEILSLEANGDTSYWFLYDFFPDGKQVVKGIRLTYNSNAKTQKEFFESENKNYHFRNEYTYEGKLRKQYREYDSNNKLQAMNDYSYSTTPPYALASTIYYTFQNSALFDTPVLSGKEIRYENYNEKIANETRLDFCVLNSQGDTIRKQTSDLDEKGKVSEEVSIDFKMNSETFRYFQNGYLTKEIFISYREMEKSIKYHYYYPNGKIREVRTQYEMLTK